MAELDRRRSRLTEALKQLRNTANVTQEDMARRAGWTQPKVSDLERGKREPTEADVRTWAAQTYATREQTEALLDMWSAIHVEYTPTADLMRRGALGRRQAHIGAMESAAARVGEYQPSLIPGMLQTVTYADAVLRLPGSTSRTKADAEAFFREIIAARVRRQQLLREPGRRWQFVLGETALWYAPGSRDLQVEQVEHLLELVTRYPDVDLRVIPDRASMPIMPLSGFRVLDEEFVYIETLYGEQRYSDRIAPIIEAFEAARRVALTGRDAVALIQRVAAELRS